MAPKAAAAAPKAKSGRPSGGALRSTGAAVLSAPGTPAAAAAGAAASAGAPPRSPPAAVGAGKSAGDGGVPSSSGGVLPAAGSLRKACGGCGSALAAGDAVYACGEEGKVMCVACAESSIAWQPKECSLCRKPFSHSAAVFRSGDAYACQECVDAAEAIRPKACSKCTGPLGPGACILRSAAEEGGKDTVLCKVCKEARDAELPKSCVECNAEFSQGQTYYTRTADKGGGSLCEKCASSQTLNCAACGLPASGKVARLGDKVYHSDCLKCTMCLENLDGGAAQGPRGLMCKTCVAKVKLLTLKVEDCMKNGDQEAAARIMDQLMAAGMGPGVAPAKEDVADVAPAKEDVAKAAAAALSRDTESAGPTSRPTSRAGRIGRPSGAGVLSDAGAAPEAEAVHYDAVARVSGGKSRAGRPSSAAGVRPGSRAATGRAAAVPVPEVPAASIPASRCLSPEQGVGPAPAPGPALVAPGVPWDDADFSPAPTAQPLALSWSPGAASGEWRAAGCLEEGPIDVWVRVCGSGVRPVLCLHGHGPDRSSCFFEGFWEPLLAAGFSVLALDLPGQGSSTGKIDARSEDCSLVLSVLSAFGASEVRALSDAGGGGAFLRAYTRSPALFAGHHILLNPITSAVPATLRTTLDEQGGDFFLIFADRWGSNDAPNRAANSKVMFEYMKNIFDRVQFATLRPSGTTSTLLKAMRPPEYLCGVLNGDPPFFRLTPSEDCIDEFLAYLLSPQRAPVFAAQAANAPVGSALEQGKVNETFKVFVRIRPMLSREQQAQSVPCMDVTDIVFPRTPPPQRIKAFDPRLASLDGEPFAHHLQKGEFVFDRVFTPGTQADVFDAVVGPLLAAFLSGTNVTVFAYGQTGTGKTYTMEGPGGDGLASQAVEQIFDEAPDSSSVYFQYVQLYDQQFTDLLHPGGEKITIIEGSKFMYLRGAEIRQAPSASEMLRDVARGASFRASGKTNMNDASSRSHAILLIMVTGPDGRPEEGTVMYMVDLAGSERVKRSGASGQQFSEAVSINSALSALGRVVTSLVEFDGARAAHIGYKDSPLTYLLKSGVGGASMTALIACITSASDSLDESMNTLRFASQASHIKNRVARKERADQAAEDAETIEGEAHVPHLTGGAGIIPLAPPLAVRGFWADEDGTVICIHDFGRDGGHFEGVLPHLPRVLAPDFAMPTEKDPEAVVHQLIALVDWLGVAKAVLFGRDFGALCAAAFKVKHPSRVSTLVLQNTREHVDAPTYKKRAREFDAIMASPNITADPFIWFHCHTNKGKEAENAKKVKGPVVFFWPNHNKGFPDPRGSNWRCKFGGLIAKNLRTTVSDSFYMGDDDVAARVREIAAK